MKRTPQWRTFNLIYLACIYSILVLGIHLAVVFLVTDQQQRSILMDEISPIIDVLTCIPLFFAAKQSITRSKRLAWAWATIALAMVCYTLGDFVWAILEVGLKLRPFPSIADGFYLAFYPVYLIGVLLLPEKQVGSKERFKKAIDIGIVMVAAILGYWNFLIGPNILSNLNQPQLSQLILLAYPVGDLVLFAALLLIINNRASGHDDVPFLLLAGSIISMIITDSIYSYQSNLGFYASGGLLDIGWILSTLLLGLAGISMITSSESRSSPEKFLQDRKIITNFKVIAPFIPYLWILGAYLLLVMSELRPLPMSSVSLSLVVGGMILLVVVRQIITSVSERSNLTDQLKNTNQELMIELAERKLADDSLHKSEKRFRSLVEHSLEEISLVNSEGILTYESATTRRPLGYPPNSIVGHSLFDLFHPDEREAAIQLLQQSVEHPGSVQEAMFRLRHQDGSWRWMEGILTNLLDEPAVQSVVINYRDITERKRAEDEVRALLEMMLGAATTESLPELLELIRQSLAKVIFAENFFVVFHNSTTGLFEEVFAIDKYDPPMSPSRLEKSITAYVFRTGQPLLLTQTEFEELKARGEVELVGTSPASWLGAPLRTPSETIGVMAVQNYEDPNCYSERDKEFIASVGAQVALVIERKRAEQEIVSLAKFPSENPNPVLRLSSEGVLMYANAASSLLLAMWGCEVGGSAPQFLCDLVSQVLASKENKTIEIECDGKVYSIIVTPMAELAYVNLYGRNITARKKAENRIGRQLEHIAALREIDRLIASSFDLHYNLSWILESVTKELNMDAGNVLILNPVSNQLDYGGRVGFRNKAHEKSLAHPGQSYAMRVILDRQVVHIPNLKAQPNDLFSTKILADEDFVCYFGVPLIARGSVKGVLEVFHRKPLEPDQEWLDFLNTLAGQAALAIDNASLFDNMQRSNMDLSMAYDATIEGWSRAMDLRDKETEGHTRRVTEMTMALAGLFGLKDEDLLGIRRGALLHDIGKMGVPDGILLKAGPLTDEEWILMKKHPTMAFEMLSPIHYLQSAIDIPYCHHEKWDGTGYPRGLKGEQIPLSARIFSVVDVWDALTSDRSYRSAWPNEKALEYLKSEAGKSFDPDVVKICLGAGVFNRNR